MRGKTAFPLTRRGAELSTVGVPGGSGLEAGGVVGWVGVTPGGSGGGRTNGETLPEVAVDSAAVGLAVAAVAPGQGSVRKEPRASAVMPLRQRVTMRKRYVVAGSSPARVVRDVSAEWATVVGDQIP